MTRKSAGGDLCQGLPPYVYDPPVEAVVFGWGVSEDGQLGLDHAEPCVMAPKVVEALLGARLRGREFGRSPLVAGSRNTIAITANGEVYSWGWNARATLGHDHRDPVTKPLRISGLNGVGVVQVALGGWHVLALDAQGHVWAWGGNEYSQCATDPSLRDVTIPTRCVPDLRVRQVAAGGMHSLALTESGQLWTWGEPWGDFSMTIDRSPRRIDRTSNFVRVVCGSFHNLALDDAGEVWSWGINDFGQLGNGTTSYATEPCRVSEGLESVRVADIAAGGWHSLALGNGGEVFVWGRGEYGRLGLGDKTGSSKLRPTQIAALEGIRVVEASCGGTHTAVATYDGRAFIWGRGGLGRLGTGEEKDCYSPVEIKLPGGPERWRVISIAAGGRHSLILAVPGNSHQYVVPPRSKTLPSTSVVNEVWESPCTGSSVEMATAGQAQHAPRQHVGPFVLEGEGEADDEGGDADEPASEDEELDNKGLLEEKEEDEDDEGVESLEGVGEMRRLALDDLHAVVHPDHHHTQHDGQHSNGLINPSHHYHRGFSDGPGGAPRLEGAGEIDGRRVSVIGSSPRGTISDDIGQEEDSDDSDSNGPRDIRARSMAAVVSHGLRDDLPGDRA